MKEQFCHEPAGVEENLEGLSADDVGFAAFGEIAIHLAEKFLLQLRN